MANDLFTTFSTRLKSAGIESVVAGDVAAMIYGELRLFQHVELLASLDDARAESFVSAFEDPGFACPPVELVRLETRRATGGRVTVLHRETELFADVVLVGEDDLDRWALDHAREVVVKDSTLRIAPPEHVIVRSLERLREHDHVERRRDVGAILQQHGDQLDNGEIANWIVRRSLQPQWESVIEELTRSSSGTLS